MKRERLAKGIMLAAICGAQWGCKDDIEEELHYNDIYVNNVVASNADTVSFGRLPEGDADYILKLTESSAEVTNPAKYKFRTDELIQVRDGGDERSIEITSYSAKTIYGVRLEMYVQEMGEYFTAAYIDSIPGFSKMRFTPKFVGERRDIRLRSGKVASIEIPYLDLGKMKPRLESEDAHFKMLQKIDAQWTCTFGNYSWKEGDTEGSWREMRPIFAREWVVIVTNYAYMMTTPEYKHAMENFSTIFGGELTDSDSIPFTKEKYKTEMERFKQPKNFVLGRTGGSVGGLGGGSTWGVSDWNYYGHYGSFSGWESITHEYMHCMGYGHNGNMTYAKEGIGWTVFAWQLHLWLSYEMKDLPYLDRHLLDFTADKNAEYRDNIGIMDNFKDDALLNKNRDNYFNSPSQKLIQYFKGKSVR